MKKLFLVAWFLVATFSNSLFAEETSNTGGANTVAPLDTIFAEQDKPIQTEIPLPEESEFEAEDLVPVARPLFSFYIGGGAIIASDTTFFDFDANKMINPLSILDYAGYNAQIGFVPLNNVSVLRYFRGEIETMYMRSNYSNIQNLEVNPDADSTSQVAGWIALKKNLMYNVYFDFKMFSDRMYPYVGYGIGKGRVAISKVDVSEVGDLANEDLGNNNCPLDNQEDTGFCEGQGLGEDWTAPAQSVNLNQFMVGFVYQVPRLKYSFNVEYRYLTSGNIEVTSYNDDMYGQTQDVTYSFHSVAVGIKYFFR